MPDSDREIIEDMERQFGAGKELEGYQKVKGRVSGNLSVTYAVRLTPEEYRQFNEAARAKGMTLADLMRSATRAALAGELDAERASALGKARETARELAETLSRL